jgi:methionyl-tRNA synthetase
MISFEDFQEMDLQVGTITDVEAITDADKLLLLSVSLGDEDRQVVAGIRQDVDSTEDLIDEQVVMVANLEPKEMFGHESQGMILAARDEKAELIQPKETVPDGTTVS